MYSWWKRASTHVESTPRRFQLRQEFPGAHDFLIALQRLLEKLVQHCISHFFGEGRERDKRHHQILIILETVVTRPTARPWVSVQILLWNQPHVVPIFIRRPRSLTFLFWNESLVRRPRSLTFKLFWNKSVSFLFHNIVTVLKLTLERYGFDRVLADFRQSTRLYLISLRQAVAAWPWAVRIARGRTIDLSDRVYRKLCSCPHKSTR